MHEPVQTQHEAVAAYSEKQVLRLTTAAYQAAAKMLDEIADGLRPGMTEVEARQMADDIFARHGVEKHWHRPYINFGAHSILTFIDPKPKDILTLQEDDIVTLDIGPVIRIEGLEIEGDIGKTVVFGDNPLFQRLKQASEEIFEQACNYWRKNQPSGIELYRYIHQLTEQTGFVFHLEPAGHLIGSFPHLGWKHGLHTYPHKPEPGIWILEIQMRHRVEPYGSFQEAVLA